MNLLEQINAKIAALEEEAKQDLNKETIEAKPKRGRGRPPKTEAGVFVEVWNAAVINGTLQDVANSLGISPACAAVKASNMRKEGYDIPQFKRGRRKKA